MAIKPKDIYDGRKKKRSWGTITAVSVIVLIALVIGLFYGLRARCIYDEDGNARIVFPFTAEAKELKAAKKQQAAEDGVNTPPPIFEESGIAPDPAEPTDNGTAASPTDVVAPEDGDTQPPEGAQPLEGAEPDPNEPLPAE